MKKEAEQGIKWKLQVSPIITRLNTLTPDTLPWVEKHDLWYIDLTNKYFTRREYIPEYLREYDKHLVDKVLEARKEAGQPPVLASDKDPGALPSDLSPEERNKKIKVDAVQKGYSFEEWFSRLQPRTSPADKTGDVRDITRRPVENVYFIVNKTSVKKVWQFPQIEWNGTETIRDSALRCARKLGPNAKLQHYGEAPSGVYKYKYSEELAKEKQAYGSKVFFFEVEYMYGDLEPQSSDWNDFAWVTKSELKEYFEPDYYEYVKQLICTPEGFEFTTEDGYPRKELFPPQVPKVSFAEETVSEE